MTVKGFKAFLPGLKTLEQDMILEIGKTYHTNQNVEFGQSGFHFCKRLEDTLHYFSNYNSPIDICEVVGFGTVVEGFHDYYGYYDLYASSDIKIVKKLSKIEILNIYKDLIQRPDWNYERIARFLHYYPELTEEDYQYLGIKQGSFKLRYY